MANKTIMRRLLRDYKKRPIISKPALRVENDTQMIEGVKAIPLRLCGEVNIRTRFIEEDPLHEQRAKGFLLDGFKNALTPAHVFFTCEERPEGKIIRGVFVAMVDANSSLQHDCAGRT